MDADKWIYIKYGLLILLVSMSLYTDLKTNKIKNVMVYPFMAVGLALNTFTGGWAGGVGSLYGVFIPIVLLLIFYLIGAMGAGDIKLLAAIGALMGKNFVMMTMAISFIVGGIIALGFMLIRKNGRERLRYLMNFIFLMFFSGKIGTYSQMEKADGGKFPFAVAIFSGVLIMIFLKK